MTKNDVGWVSADFGDWVGAGGALLLLADFDGTLAPPAPDPGEVRASAAVRQALAALPRPPEISVAIISGRDIGDLRARLGIQRLIYAGCHGLEVSGPDLAFRHPEAERQTRMARMRQTVREHNIYRWAGLLLEELSRIPEEAGSVRVP